MAASPRAAARFGSYEEDTFTSLIAALSDQDEWQRRSNEAHEQAERLTWDQTLRPLQDMLSEPTG